MIDHPAWLIGGGPVVAGDVVMDMAKKCDADLTVDVAGTLVDVARVDYDTDREKFVLRLHPDDLAEVLRKLFRNRAHEDQADDRSAGKENSMNPMLADASTIRGWQKARKCDNSGPNCVEVAPYGNGVAVRNSQAPTGPALVFNVQEWRTFIGAAKGGEFDHLAG